MFRALRKTRQIGDYGVFDDVSEVVAMNNLEFAKQIIETVYKLSPNEFSQPPWMKDQKK